MERSARRVGHKHAEGDGQEGRACFVPLVFVGLLLAGCSPPELVTHALPLCTDVEVREEVALTVSQGSTPSLQIEHGVVPTTDDPISLSGSGIARLSCPNMQSLQLLGKAKVVVDALNGVATVRSYGESELVIKSLHASALDLRASGRAKLVITDIDTDEVMVQAGGQSQLVLSGVTGTMALNAVGTAVVDAHEFRAQSAELSGNGTGLVALWVTAHLRLGTDIIREPAINGDPAVTDDRGESR